MALTPPPHASNRPSRQHPGPNRLMHSAMRTPRRNLHQAMAAACSPHGALTRHSRTLKTASSSTSGPRQLTARNAPSLSGSMAAASPPARALPTPMTASASPSAAMSWSSPRTTASTSSAISTLPIMASSLRIAARSARSTWSHHSNGCATTSKRSVAILPTSLSSANPAAARKSAR